MAIAPRIEAHLQRVGVHYNLIEHPRSKTSIQSARSAQLPPTQVAKAVIAHDGDKYCMCVLPANRRLVLDWLNQRMHGRYRLATETEISALFDDCEPGAVPPLGQVYGMPVIWDDELNDVQDIYLESGDHEHLIHLDHGAFLELMGLQAHDIISCMQGESSGNTVH
ncbi:MAG TPA: aminoacyl-tRNA deacylase [Spongiibacteraceae bacterium]|nr:aminoacyl-tRNA deacylase [Spongiibacteraceae bacterium]HCS28135.1 aminoacyl-tRNA deacylase [Spongiibacteraceae bacterium]|tara:strand:- start:76 stop:573 length:498 start_codon:yes stop_codon:yes gene_type:complete